jgi:O-acetyl-ADP-ribose deacetylase (regulator of RNase III)
MVPDLILGDTKTHIIELAEQMGIGDEWVRGDPMSVNLDAIVSPANTIGEMSGGYDLKIRTYFEKYQKIPLQQIVQKSIQDKPMVVGQARAIKVGGTIPWIIIVPTVIGRNDSFGKMQTKTPSLDIVHKGTYNFMKAAQQAGIKRVGSVLLGAGVGGGDPRKCLEAMGEGYFDFLDEVQGNI